MPQYGASLAQDPALNKGSDGLDAGPVAVRKVDHVDAAGLARSGDHANGVRIVQCKRLLAENVLARLETLKRERGVKSVRRDVADRVEIPVCEQFFQTGVRGRDAVLLAEGIRVCRVDVNGGDNLAVLDLLKSLGVETAHAPSTEKGEADSFLTGLAHG